MAEGKRIIYLEKLRVFALWLVLYMHSGQIGATYYLNASTTLGYWVSLFLVPISQCCVMLFFMISGAVLLHKQESFKRLYLHRVLPMAVVIVLFVLIQYLQNCADFGMTFSFQQYLECLYSGGAITQQWFLYAYLAFLLILPFLRAIAAGLRGTGMYRYLFVLMLIVNTVFPMWEAVSDWKTAGLSVPMLTNIIFYPLMGHYIAGSGDELLENGKILAVWDGIAVVLAVGNVLMNRHSMIVGGKAAYPIVFLAYFTCVIFWNFKLFGNKSRHGALWCFAGAGVFGTYLFEQQLRLLFKPLFRVVSEQSAPYLWNLLVLTLMMVLGIVLTNLLKKFPGVKLLL